MENSVSVLAVTPWGDRPEIETLIGLARRGCRVRVCCMPESPYIDRFEEAGIGVVTAPLRRRIELATIRAIRTELTRHDPDILHLLHNRAISNGLLAVRGFDRVKVIAYRGIVGNVSVLDPTAWLRHLNPRVDRVVCVAEAVRKSLLDAPLVRRRLPPEKLVTIHKGHDLAWYTAPAADRAALGIPGGAFVVGCIANWRPRKGLEVLLEAFRYLPAEAPIFLLLAGRLTSRRLRRAIASHVRAERILNLGYRTDAPRLIGACDVSVLPTVRREGLPKTVIEAMAYGVAPIVTDCGGSPELVAHGRSGLVVPPGDAAALREAVLSLYEDPELRARLARAARQRIATEFNIERTIDRTLALYRELLG